MRQLFLLTVLGAMLLSGCGSKEATASSEPGQRVMTAEEKAAIQAEFDRYGMGTRR
ncbi:MAG TPA: hypothetical protein VGE01_02310 [Fimbriimonas sp.]